MASANKIPLIGILAIRHSYLSREQLKYALTLQQEDLKTGKKTSLPEIFAKTGMISTENMAQLHKLVQRHEEELTPADESPLLSLSVSEDKLEAELVANRRLDPSVTLETIKGMLEEKEITYGIATDSLILEFIENGREMGHAMTIARGRRPRPGKPAKITFHFDSEYYRKRPDQSGEKEPSVKEGALLAEKVPAVQAVAGIDVYGTPIEVDMQKDIPLRSGTGTAFDKENLKLFATGNGAPMASVEGTVSVFPERSFSDDIGVKTGPIEEEANIRTTGIVTKEYPIKGGSLKAEEIRSATVHLTGSLQASIGINGATIYAQGNVTAKYIHNATIYTYGSVIAENEIMDSTISACGQVSSRTSKIIASTIKAGGGIYAAGVGTRISNPCALSIGTGDRVADAVEEIETGQEDLFSEIEKLNAFSAELQTEKTENESKIVELVKFHRQADQAIKATKAKVTDLTGKDRPEELKASQQTLKTLVTKNRTALSSLKKLSDKQKINESQAKGIPLEIGRLEQKIAELESDKESILAWAEKLTYNGVLDVSGELTAGTVVTGPNTELKIEKNVTNVVVSEQESKSAKIKGIFMNIRQRMATESQ